MNALHLFRPFRSVRRISPRHPSEIGAIPIRGMNGHPPCSTLYVSDQVRAWPNVSSPPRAGIKHRRHVRPGIYGMWVRNDEYGLRAVAATIAPTSKFVHLKFGDRGGCGAAVRHGDDCQVVFVVPVAADHHHVGANMKDRPRPAFKPASKFKRQRACSDNCGIDRKQRLHGHSTPHFVQCGEYDSARSVHAMSTRGVSTTFPTALGTGAGRQLPDFQCKEATG